MIIYAGKCANCGATNSDQKVAKCGFCHGNLAHDEKLCECKPCQNARDMEAAKGGLALLKLMKRDKQDLRVRERQLGLDEITCSVCQMRMPSVANFCNHCGQKLH